jgi:hypothetical protein
VAAKEIVASALEGYSGIFNYFYLLKKRYLNN